MLGELLELLALLRRRSGRGARTGVGLAGWDRLWIELAWIGLSTPGVLPTLVYGHRVDSLSVADTGRWGGRGQLRRRGLIHRYRDIGACSGSISEQGYPVVRWAVIDLVHRTGWGRRSFAHRFRITAGRSSYRAIAPITHRWGRRRVGGCTQRE
ncbi:MAG: hypothetical protein ACRDRX_26270 [Pseudonocardiaceae bacterium]